MRNDRRCATAKNPPETKIDVAIAPTRNTTATTCPKWVQVSDAGTAAFRKRNKEAKAS